MPYQIDFHVGVVDWDNFIESSPQKNIFCKTVFLDALECGYDRIFVGDGNRPLLGAVVLKQTSDLPFSSPHIFSLYHGIAMSREHTNLAPHRRIKAGLDLIEALLVGCSECYPFFNFSLHHALEDLRALQWFNYHSPERGRIKLQLHYTGLINLEKTSSFEDYLASIREAKRRQYRKGQKLFLRVGTLDDIGVLAYLHKLTFERQDIVHDSKQDALLRAISTAAISKNFGELLIAESSSGESVAATLFLHDSSTSYYLFGGNHPEYRKTGAGTFLILENIRRAMAMGLRSVDLIGINSPNRGDFKTSLNALPTPYFTATWPGIN
jgi:hypothetical protein